MEPPSREQRQRAIGSLRSSHSVAHCVADLAQVGRPERRLSYRAYALPTGGRGSRQSAAWDSRGARRCRCSSQFLGGSADVAVAVAGGRAVELTDLAKIRSELIASGWAVSIGAPEEVLSAIRRDGSWRELPNSPGATRQSTTLKPTTQAAAAPRSLSAVYGLSAQPLHTDGAHLEDRPDIIMLGCASTSTTNTLVHAPNPWEIPDFVRTGLFTVGGGKGKFLASAFDEGFRFDPVMMRPADHLARRTVAYFEAQRHLAHPHEWSTPNLLLFIDNKRCLHAREAVRGDSATRRVVRYAFKQEAAA